MITKQILQDTWIVTTDKGKYVGMVREYQDGSLLAFQDGKPLYEELDVPEDAEKLFEK